VKPACRRDAATAHYPGRAGSALRKGRYRHCISIVLLCLGLLAGCGHGDVRPASALRAVQIAKEGPGPRPGNADAANAVLMRAISLVGTPYRYGGNTPEGGFDCSGLVAYVFRDVLDLRLPRSSRELAVVQGPPIAPDRLESADLVFFGTQQAVSHVGIYVGEGRFVHAPSSGGTVRLDALDGAYWRDHYSGARRVLPRSD